MDTQPEHQALDTLEIHFSNGNRAQAVLLHGRASIEDLVHTLNIPTPGALIVIAGGASKMEKRLAPQLALLFTYALAHVAASLDALIIDGGTQAGVMELAGLGVASQPHRPFLLGVAPAGSVTYPGKSSDAMGSQAAPLDPNHSHFVLVESNRWGGETATMYALAHIFSQGIPSVAVLINGGDIARSEMIYNVEQKRPIIVLEGSGRIADEIANALHGRPSARLDSELARIVADGDLYLFPLAGSALALEQLTRHVLSQQ
jgi:hypothetical protein